MWSATPRAAGITLLAKYNIKEAIPLAMAMMDVPENFEMGSDEYISAALKALVGYGDAARWTLPKLKEYLVKWDPASSQYAVLVNTIASIETAVNAPELVPAMAEATSQVVAATGAKAITLIGASPRTPVTYKNVTTPTHGTLSGTAPNLTYTPTNGYTGIDRFTFQTVDNLTTSDPGTVSIIIGTAGNGL